MKTHDFNNFFSNLKKDKSTYEHFTFAFLDMTPKQIVKCIDYYKSIGECEITIREYDGKEFYTFAVWLNYPVSEYNKVKAGMKQ